MVQPPSDVGPPPYEAMPPPPAGLHPPPVPADSSMPYFLPGEWHGRRGGLPFNPPPPGCPVVAISRQHINLQSKQYEAQQKKAKVDLSSSREQK